MLVPKDEADVLVFLLGLVFGCLCWLVLLLLLCFGFIGVLV